MNSSEDKLERRTFSVFKTIANLELSGFGSALPTACDEYYEDRFYYLVEQLSNNEIELTEDLLNSEEKFDAIATTFRATMRNKSRQKIKFLANLLSSELKRTNPSEEFKDLIKLLDELTYPELTILATLNKYQTGIPLNASGFSQVSMTDEYWGTLSLKVNPS